MDKKYIKYLYIKHGQPRAIGISDDLISDMLAYIRDYLTDYSFDEKTEILVDPNSDIPMMHDYDAAISEAKKWVVTFDLPLEVRSLLRIFCHNAVDVTTQPQSYIQMVMVI